MTKEEHEKWCSEIFAIIDTIENCASCLKPYSPTPHSVTGCPRCGHRLTLTRSEAFQRLVLDPTDAYLERAKRWEREQDPAIHELIRDIYRAQKRREARSTNHEDL